MLSDAFRSIFTLSSLKLTKLSNGIDITGDEIFVSEYVKPTKYKVVSTKRIGIDYAEEAKDYDWRFILKIVRMYQKNKTQKKKIYNFACSLT